DGVRAAVHEELPLRGRGRTRRRRGADRAVRGSGPDRGRPGNHLAGSLGRGGGCGGVAKPRRARAAPGGVRRARRRVDAARIRDAPPRVGDGRGGLRADRVGVVQLHLERAVAAIHLRVPPVLVDHRVPVLAHRPQPADDPGGERAVRNAGGVQRVPPFRAPVGRSRRPAGHVGGRALPHDGAVLRAHDARDRGGVPAYAGGDLPGSLAAEQQPVVGTRRRRLVRLRDLVPHRDGGGDRVHRGGGGGALGGLGGARKAGLRDTRGHRAGGGGRGGGFRPGDRDRVAHQLLRPPGIDRSDRGAAGRRRPGPHRLPARDGDDELHGPGVAAAHTHRVLPVHAVSVARARRGGPGGAGGRGAVRVALGVPVEVAAPRVGGPGGARRDAAVALVHAGVRARGFQLRHGHPAPRQNGAAPDRRGRAGAARAQERTRPGREPGGRGGHHV
ncbi:MAG: hypothetical protein AVDCRST_MAG89-1146, partial [uncultured Gemmatimonadetes bacterium]